MTTQDPTLLVQPSKKWQMLAFLFLLITYFSIELAFIFASPNDKFAEISVFRLVRNKFSIIPFCIEFILFFGTAYGMLYVQFFTPYAYLLLTPHGFIAHSWLKSRHRNYRWHEVSSFYVGQSKDSESGPKKCISFDVLAVPPGKDKQKVLDSVYSKSSEHIVGELNRWRDQYAQIANMDFAVLKPITLSRSEVWTPWTVVAASLWLVSLVIVVYFAIHKIQLSLLP